MFLVCSPRREQSMPAKALDPEPAFPTEADIDAVLEEFGGDPRAAVRALLADLATLASDFEATVSHGYVRGELPRLKKRA